MTLVKTKHRPPAHQRKMGGQHHRKNQTYLKTYWPYIPIILILGGSLLVNELLPTSLSGSRVTSRASSARLDSVLGTSNVFLYDFLFVVLIGLVAFYIVRHFKRLRSLLIEGEEYLARHYVLDIMLGLAIGTLYVLVA